MRGQVGDGEKWPNFAPAESMHFQLGGHTAFYCGTFTSPQGVFSAVMKHFATGQPPCARLTTRPPLKQSHALGDLACGFEVVGHQLIDVFVAADLGKGHDVDLLDPSGERLGPHMEMQVFDLELVSGPAKQGVKGAAEKLQQQLIAYGQRIKNACSCEVLDQAATIWVRAFDGPLSLAGAVKTPVFFWKLTRMDILTNSKGCAAPALPSLHSLLD